MKVCIVCYGLKENNVRLQPWRYILEIARGLISKGADVKIITDAKETEHFIQNIPIHSVEKLRAVPFMRNNKLISLIRNERPNIIIWSISPMDYFYRRNFKNMEIPIIGMFTGPIYRMSDISRLGSGEIVSNLNSLFIHMIYAALPSLCNRSLVNSIELSKVFVMSQKNRNLLVSMGADASKIIHIPAGIDEYDLIQPEFPKDVINKFNISPGSFNILYFGSPLKIRGIDSLVRAVAKVAKNNLSVKLLILSRRREEELNKEEKAAVSLIHKLGLENNVQIVSGFLDKESVKRFIKFSDIVCLPFKIVPSDVPTSILESMAMGKMVISTNVDGIPELLESGRGIVVEPNDEEDLATKIKLCMNNADLLRKAEKRSLDFMIGYPIWDDIADRVLQEIKSVLHTNKGASA